MKKRIISIIILVFMLFNTIAIMGITASAADDGIIFSSADENEVGRAARRDRSLYENTFSLYFPEESYIDKIYVDISVVITDFEREYSGNMGIFIGRSFDGTSKSPVVSFDSDDISGNWASWDNPNQTTTYIFSVRKLVPAGLYTFVIYASNYVKNGDGDMTVTVYGEAEGMKEITEDAYKKMLEDEKAANVWKLTLPEVKFTSNKILVESNPTTDWNPKRALTETLEFALFVDEEVTINDLYFETQYTGTELAKDSYDYNEDGLPDNLLEKPTNLRIEISKANSTMYDLISLKTYKADIYECSDDSIFYYNSFKQLTGTSGMNLTLKRGVYHIKITPQKETQVLLGMNYNDIILLVDFGAVVTGTSKGTVTMFSPDTFLGLYPLVQGVNAGKTVEQINESYVAEIEAAEEAKRKAEEERKKAEAEKKKAEEDKKKKEAEELAKKPITLKVNGVVVKTDSPPVIESGRTLAPVRAIVEALGYIVAWDSSTQIVDIYDPNTQELMISLKIGSNKARVATGIWGVTDERILDVPAKIIGGRTMVPVRFIAETLGCTVGWDEKTKTVSITQAAG